MLFSRFFNTVDTETICYEKNIYELWFKKRHF